MTAYNFDPRWITPIASGAKRQTIRKPREGAGHAKPGGTLQLYTGLRTPNATLIARATCTEVLPVQLTFSPERLVMYSTRPGVWAADPRQCDRFAQRDGFADAADMRAFWAEKHPGVLDFSGFLIRWELQP